MHFQLEIVIERAERKFNLMLTRARVGWLCIYMYMYPATRDLYE
jgi:hypothetical protein